MLEPGSPSFFRVSAAAEMDWSSQEVLDFISHYEDEPMIWDPSHQDYKNRHSVHEAWGRIAKAMNDRFEIRELKAKKLSLMATYRKLATKVRSCLDEPYKPDWFAYEAMDRFLNGVYEPRTGPARQEFKVEQTSSADDDEHITEEIAESEASLEAALSDRIPNLNSYLEVTVDEPPSRKRPHSSSPPGNTSTAVNRLDNGFTFLKSIFEKPELDECSLFGEFIAKKLRSLDEDTREVAMLEIHNTLFQVGRRNGDRTVKTQALQAVGNPPMTYPSSSQG